VHADVREALQILNERQAQTPIPNHVDWLAWCHERRRKYPVVQATTGTTPRA